MKCWALCSLGMAVLAGASMSSAAQQPAKVFHIGILSPAAASSTKAFDAFRGGLRELGYIEGSNVEIEYRLRRADGVYRPFLARGKPVHDREGRVVKWFGMLTELDHER